jgi:hypothetical protein
MFDVMATGKRAAVARKMVAQSEVNYRRYVTAVLRTGRAVRKAWTDGFTAFESARTCNSQ